MRLQRSRQTEEASVRSHPIFTQALSTDVVIPVVGKTGVGKSTFINDLLGKPDRMKVGHGLDSQTADLEWDEVEPAVFSEACRWWAGDRRVIIVDSPGFKCTSPQEDLEVVKRIAVWLTSSYSASMKLGGVIYLHNIAEPRIEGPNPQVLAKLKELCGFDACSRVVPVTTSWADIKPPASGEFRQMQVKEMYWKWVPTVNLKRFDRSQRSAVEIVQHILKRSHLNSSQTLPDMDIHITQCGEWDQLLSLFQEFGR